MSNAYKIVAAKPGGSDILVRKDMEVPTPGQG